MFYVLPIPRIFSLAVRNLKKSAVRFDSWKSVIIINESIYVQLQFTVNSLQCTDGWQQQQDSQCTDSVTLRGVLSTVVVLESGKFYILWVCVCSLRYPAWNVHAPCFHLGSASCTVFSKLSQKGTIFWIQLLSKIVFWFSIQMSSKMFYIQRKHERDVIKCISVFV